MNVQWEAKVGPATIAAILGAIGVIATNVWIASSNYRGLADKIEMQSDKIEDVSKGSDKRFQTVRNALGDARKDQLATADRVSRMETAVSFIRDQVQQLVAKVDGK